MRIYAKVTGRVQGIGYRFFVVQTAKRLFLTGWVRNCADGGVECEAQGDEKHLNDFLLKLEQGHSWARVESIHKESVAEKQGEADFEIAY